MSIPMKRHLMPRRGDLADHARMTHCLLTNHKERRPKPQLLKTSEDGRRTLGMRAVVERQDN